ncbi:MAG: ABC transporter permease [Hydrogenophilaceae bacterium]|nr:ABC transporter permease [Hydrogenophilaceae bacterium]
MSERIKLLAYLVAIIIASWTTSPAWLTGGLLATLLLCGRDAMRMVRRAIVTTIAFSGIVSAAYAGYRWLAFDTLPLDWLVTVNLRVLLMAMLTFLVIARVNLFQALSVSRRFSFLLVLAVSQSIGLKRVLDEFRMGLHSRSIRPASLRDRYRAVAHAAGWLVDKSLGHAHESAQALKSRGLFK